MEKLFSSKPLVLLLFVMGLSQSLRAFGPNLNKYDPFCVVGPQGTDPFPALASSEIGEPGMFFLELAPFYSEATTARGPEGRSTHKATVSGGAETPVSVFEENGKWNLPGFYYPLAEVIFNPSLYPNATAPDLKQVYDLLPSGWQLSSIHGNTNKVPSILAEANRNLPQAIALGLLGGPSNYTAAKYGSLVDSLFGAAFPGATKDSIYKDSDAGGADFADAKESKRNWLTGASAVSYGSVSRDYRKYLCPSTVKDAETQTLGFDTQTIGSIGKFLYQNEAGNSIASKYTRQGLRARMVLNFAPGIRFWAQGGLCQHKTDVRFFDTIDPAVSLPNKISDDHSRAMVNQLFYKPNFQRIAQIFNLDASDVLDWSAEDTFAAVDLSAPVMFLSPSGGASNLKIWPTLSLGIWLPTSRKPDKNEPISFFRIPTGSDGHYGVSVSASISLDVKGQLFLNAGGACSIFNTKTIDREIVLTNSLQVGFSPLVTSVSRKPGKTYCGWGALHSRKFQDNFSVFVQYMAAVHRPDELTVTDEILRPLFNPTSIEYFEPANALRNQMARTAWMTQDLYAGLAIEASPNIHLSLGFKGNIIGYSVPICRTAFCSARITL